MRDGIAESSIISIGLGAVDHAGTGSTYAHWVSSRLGGDLPNPRPRSFFGQGHLKAAP
jgi:hypothetical protein